MPRLARRLVPRTLAGRLVALAVVLVVLASVSLVGVAATRDSFTTEQRVITVHTGPHGDEPVRLDTTLYLPKSASRESPVPVVLMPHGFGGSKDSVARPARKLVELGYAVQTWTAEGFGRSGGQIHMDSPDYEVTDARRLIDRLASRPDIVRDGPGDPRVGIVGTSYGGALALLTAGHDRRVDSIVPQVTWNDLGTALFPNAAGGPVTTGVPKRQWLGHLFTAGAGGPAAGTGCGRFAPDVCRLYRDALTSGRADAATARLLRRSSPSSVIDEVRAPTLLIQGTSDSLFSLGEADANARGIAATGTPVRVAWLSSGHDGPGSATDARQGEQLTAQWLDETLKQRMNHPDTSFTYSNVIGRSRDGVPETTSYTARRYPGIDGERVRRLSVSHPPQTIANPPGGTPAAISSLPGLGALTGGAPTAGGTRLTREVPGQAASFESATLHQPLDVAGSPRVSVRVASPTASAVLFAKLYDVAPNGQSTLVGGQSAPARLDGLPKGDSRTARPTEVRLPAVVHRFPSGHRLRVVLSTADQAFAGPDRPTSYVVRLADGQVDLPQVASTPVTGPAGVWRWVLGGLVGAIAAGLLVALLVTRTRRRHDEEPAEDAGIPLVVRDLRKTYADGFTALDGVGFSVGPDQVVGLLGPNGAGKTTMLRILLGLVHPTGGEAVVFGHRIVPGAPVLSRLGALVEGPGLLTHLSGVENLRLYWRATGRPTQDARFDEVLTIAALGDAVHRPVRTYSHGMRQRLAIAQAMLGMPELLVLDEPTDGLDPPQIAEMREVLRRYATDGRSVLVSSHLLGEVEQTCTHVVVLNEGTLVAAGSVADIIGVDTVLPFRRLEDAFLALLSGHRP